MRADRNVHIDDADFPRRSNRIAQFNFLTRYAMLAPSSHNSQPWKFATKNYKLLLLADRSRGLPVADGDRREMHVSLGCGLENLLIAAGHFGYACEVECFPSPDDGDLIAKAGLVSSDGASLHHPELFDAITRRRTNRHAYEPTPLSCMHERHCARAATKGASRSTFTVRGDSKARSRILCGGQMPSALQIPVPQGTGPLDWTGFVWCCLACSQGRSAGRLTRRRRRRRRTQDLGGTAKRAARGSSELRESRPDEPGAGRAGIRADRAHRLTAVDSTPAHEPGPGDPRAALEPREHVRQFLPGALSTCFA